MSLSPESFDRLLADKLAQMPAPAYDPAHWDMLEDQLQHLTSASTSGKPAQPTPTTPPPAPLAGHWLAGSVAKFAAVAALASVTAVNGYLYLQSQQRPVVGEVVMIPGVGASEPRALSPAETAPLASTHSAANEIVAEPSHVIPAPQAANEKQPTISENTAPQMPSSTAADATDHPVLVVPPPAALATLPAPSVSTSAVSSETKSADPAPQISPNAISSTAPEATAPSATVSTESVTGSVPQAQPDIITPNGDRYNIITPNGDGLNDRFELPLPAGSCRLKVYDNRGHVVYQNAHYDNSWEATNLPDGVYIYSIETLSAPIWGAGGWIKVQR
jgi:CHU_C Type IX secretion signal domain